MALRSVVPPPRSAGCDRHSNQTILGPRLCYPVYWDVAFEYRHHHGWPDSSLFALYVEQRSPQRRKDPPALKRHFPTLTQAIIQPPARPTSHPYTRSESPWTISASLDVVVAALSGTCAPYALHTQQRHQRTLSQSHEGDSSVVETTSTRSHTAVDNIGNRTSASRLGRREANQSPWGSRHTMGAISAQ